MFFANITFAQHNRELAEGMWREAQNLSRKGDDNGAEKMALQAIAKDSTFGNPYILLVKTYFKHGYLDDAEYIIKKLLRINPNEYPEAHFMAANIIVRDGKYEETYNYLKKYLSFSDDKVQYRTMAEKMLKDAEFAKEAIKNPVPFNPVNLGSGVNSELDEYLPSISIDGKMLVLTVQVPKMYQAYGEKPYQEDFYVSNCNNDIWSTSKPMSDINTQQNEGAQAISPDGKYLYFTACNRQDGVGECDLYISEWTGDKWSTPRNLGVPVNSTFWDSQPSISSDGNSLYFTSTRDVSSDKPDLYCSTKDKNGRWTLPKKLPATINTPEAEQFPFIHSDNKTLYFGSNGLPGFGGFDLYMSKKDENGNWGEAVNLGYPINTSDNELSLIVNAMGNKAYFASNREGGKGKQDIYEFELYEKIRPQLVSYLKGTVYDSETKVPLIADFELVNLATNEKVIISKSDNKGKFLVALPSGIDYALNVSKDGYLFYSESFMMKDNSNKEPFLMDVPLNKINIGEKVILRNIFFETNSFVLKDESISELNNLIQFLTKNPKINIEISGHTDNVGTFEKNKELSLNRAKSVYEFLLKNNISAKRLTYFGYADSQPIDTNETEKGRSINRRTEFKIVE